MVQRARDELSPFPTQLDMSSLCIHRHAYLNKANQRSPIFLQWLFCVAAIQAQFPDDFLFSRDDLDVLVDLWLSGWTCYIDLVDPNMQDSFGVSSPDRPSFF